jgi:hypothetical protein
MSRTELPSGLLRIFLVCWRNDISRSDDEAFLKKVIIAQPKETAAMIKWGVLGFVIRGSLKIQYSGNLDIVYVYVALGRDVNKSFREITVILA